MQEGVNEGLLTIDDVVTDVCIAALGTDLIAERRTCTESLVYKLSASALSLSAAEPVYRAVVRGEAQVETAVGHDVAGPQFPGGNGA